MTKEKKNQQNKLYFKAIIIISFLVFTMSYLIAQTFKWTDQYQGFLSGCSHFVPLCKIWCYYILPWSIVVYLLYRLNKLIRIKAQCLILAPVILACVYHTASVLTTPLAPNTRFQRFSKTHLPPNLQDFSYNFSGGGFDCFADLYYFRTSPREVDRLISNLQLYIETRYGKIPVKTQNSAIKDFPTLSSWTNATQYVRFNDELSCYLATNEGRNEVFISILYN